MNLIVFGRGLDTAGYYPDQMNPNTFPFEHEFQSFQLIHRSLKLKTADLAGPKSDVGYNKLQINWSKQRGRGVKK